MALHLYSEPYRPEGNIDARAAKRAIGRPRMDKWAVFLRETVQNSWDAKLPAGRRIGFSIDATRLDSEQTEVLRSEVFGSRPKLGSTLATTLKSPVSFLLVTDRGTRGLQGATRADRTATEKADFVDFVRNIGRAEDKDLGGGTYGFGKGVLFEASSCSTILLFSRTTFNGKPVARFMAISLGLSYDSGGRRYTGRHWWGVKDKDTGAEPVTGREAERLASAVGMNSILRGETGTVLAVVGPVVEDEDLDALVQRIADAATWWAWPHMVGTDGPTIDFSFSSEGRRISGPDPLTDPVLRHYVEAYRRASHLLSSDDDGTGEWPWVAKRVTSQRPFASLGVLSYRHYPGIGAAPVRAVTGTAPSMGSHVALMRNPRLIVRYWEAPPDPTGQGTAGVFIANPRKNGDFALAEPVAHDDWVPDNLQLQRYERNPVKIALDRLRAEFSQGARHSLAPPAAGSDSGATRLASAIGGLLAPGSGDGTSDARIQRPQGGRGRPSKQRPPASGREPGLRSGTAVVAGEGVLRWADHGIEVEFPVAAEIGDGVGIRITAEARVVLDGGVSEAPEQAPLGADRPAVLGWTDAATGEWLARGRVIQLTGPLPAGLGLRVHQPADSAVTVHLDVEPLP
jgi:hypothetical protein